MNATTTGPVPFAKSPFADNPLSVAFGFEYRAESGFTSPDLCRQLAPTSCLGGAGGNTLPVAGNYSVREGIIEGILPLVENKPLLQNVELELGYRYSDYDLTGVAHTWKAGINWTVTESIRLRANRQRAVRAPNVGELFAPQTASLDNALGDPCSDFNPGAANNARLRDLCILTGQTAVQVGRVQDIAVGQINTFSGTNPDDLPSPEVADTWTAGIQFSPNLGGVFQNTLFTFDYYKINIEDTIGTLSPQEVLDGCYVLGNLDNCANIRRVAGGLTLPGSGIALFNTNLLYQRANGVEFGLNTAIDLSAMGVGANAGVLDLTFNGNYYLAADSQSTPINPIIDCNGFFGTSCNPQPKFRFSQTGTWIWNDFSLGYLWRYIGPVERQTEEAAGTFPGFREIGGQHYIDIRLSYQLFESVRFNASIENINNNQPPVVGNEAGSTTFNSGNTFPSLYDTLGRIWTAGVTVKF